MTKKITTCDFDLDENTKCEHTAHLGHKYCLEHLELLTRIHLKTAIYNCISEQLGVDIATIEDSSRIMDDLNADSLDTVELVMALEELFNFEVPDEDAEKLSTVKEVFTYTYNKLQHNSRYIPHPFNDVIEAYEIIKQKVSCIRREVATIIKSELFQEYISSLKLETKAVENIIVNTIRGNWIEHVTTVPEFDNKGPIKFLGSHIMLLSKKYIFYFHLKKMSVGVKVLRLNEFSLRSEYIYAETGEISAILVKFYHQRHGDKVALKFKFDNDASVIGADTFLNKYYMFSEDNQHIMS